ncbi:Werner Syndrome-like exonuclease [Glycine soja]|uniref:Werner Syndrome-like exonuclease n=1 Tax=Glycine soja TaxID=3848 RepID=A0A445FUY6_GLYSO|nr:Werner Syndrome-like exonuclease [Glycine soja]RZB52745.1 Werner Syndrome-like exonuclease [Glycine soja]
MVEENSVPLWIQNRMYPVVTMSVVDHNLPFHTHNYNLYEVTFQCCHYDTIIHTLLTSDPSRVASWLPNNDGVRRRNNLMVGLDVEWRPNYQPNPVATLQLCIGHRCLIFQIIHAPSIPAALISFLANPNITFFGVGIRADAEKLLVDYNLHVANVRDLRPLAVERLSRAFYPDVSQAGLATLARHVLGVAVEKPQWITRSRWDDRRLTKEQVQYATIDAFLSYEIGRQLNDPSAIM